MVELLVLEICTPHWKAKVHDALYFVCLVFFVIFNSPDVLFRLLSREQSWD